MSDLSKAVIYQPKQDIAGVRPIFVLPNDTYPAYFDEHGGAPEAELITWAEQFLKGKNCFMDVGSHLGTWSLTYALKNYLVHSFEAQPWVYKLLRAGVALNGLDVPPGIHTQNFALGAHKGGVHLTAPHDDGGGGSVICKFDDPVIDIQVQMETMDYWNRRVDLLKIDVEGAELDVLIGGNFTIKQWQPTIIFECWADERGQRKEELFRFLHDELGYSTTAISWPETYLATPKAH